MALNLPYQQQLNLNLRQVSGRAIALQDSLVNVNYAMPGMFEALQIPLLRGRVFTNADGPNSARVTVVNDTFVRHYFSGKRDPLVAPIGSQVEISGVGTYQIVGVVHAVQQKPGWGSYGPLATMPQIYIPASQVPDSIFELINGFMSPNWIVRTHGDLPGLAEAMRHALETVDPRLPFSAFHSMSEIRGASLRDQRYQATLFSALAGLAMLLAALGVYGLIAQSVAQRTREMGIRLALGATSQNVVRSAAAPGVTLSLAGIACGLILAIFASRLLNHLIWGVTATDPATYVAVALLLLLIAALSSIIPALRLARLDPAQTLRNE